MRKTWDRLRPATVLLACVAFAPTAGATELVVVARAGAGEALATIDAPVAVNEHGLVAFTGTDADGSKLFVAPQPGLVLPISFWSTDRVFMGAAVSTPADASDPARVASHDRVSGSPPFYLVRTWNSLASADFTVVGRSPDDWDAATRFLDVNDSGLVAAVVLTGGATMLSLVAGRDDDAIELGTWSITTMLRPQVANSGDVVVRDNVGRIVTITHPLGVFGAAATSSMGFVDLNADGAIDTGMQPGIDRDGAVVAFIGDQGSVARAFLSVGTPSGRQLIPVNGRDADGIPWPPLDVDQPVRVASRLLPDGRRRVRVCFSMRVGTDSFVYAMDLRLAPRPDGTWRAYRYTPELLIRTGQFDWNGNGLVDDEIIDSVVLGDATESGLTSLRVQLAGGDVVALLAQPECHSPGGEDDDSDGDGLRDAWELAGAIDCDADGTADLRLAVDWDGDGHLAPRERADWRIPDVFVEVDWMTGRDPDWWGLELVRRSFERSNVRLHLDVSEEVPLVTELEWTNCGPSGGSSTFPEVKAASFGRDGAQRSDAQAMRARRAAFRYGLFGDRIHGVRSSGCGEVGGDDVLVALGGLPGWRLEWETGTFMHELGHAVGLRHGGHDDVNCKPNHLSVMSYLRQLPWSPLPMDRPLDYSTQELPTLHELTLDESQGIGRDLVDCRLDDPCVTMFSTFEVWSALGPIDWNGDGVYGTVGWDVNWMTPAGQGCDPFPGQALEGHDDWANLKVAPGPAGALDHGAIPPPEVEELALETALELSGDLDADGVVDFVDVCPEIADSSQVDADGDAHGAACDCDDASPTAWDLPGEATDLRFVDQTTLEWRLPDAIGGMSAGLLQDVVRSRDPRDFTSAATCITLLAPLASRTVDDELPGIGQVFFYVVQARNACGTAPGGAGRRSDGTPRAARTCP